MRTRRPASSSTARCIRRPSIRDASTRSCRRSARRKLQRIAAWSRCRGSTRPTISTSCARRMIEWRAAGRDGDAFPYTFPVVGRRPLNLQPHRRTARPVQLRHLDAHRGGNLGCGLLGGADRACGAGLRDRRRAHGLRPVPAAGPSCRRRLSRRLFLPQQRGHRRRACASPRDARVAILDVDYHHGNGTQDIFYDRGDVAFASIHADPATDYPFFWGHADETGPARAKAQR